MKRRTVFFLHWGSSILLALMMLGLAYAYVAVPYFGATLQRLGFPLYFMYVLAIAKTFGAIGLLIRLPLRLKTFVYDGFAIMFVCGALAHVAGGDPPSKASGGLIALTLLIVSGVTRAKLLEQSSQQAQAS